MKAEIEKKFKVRGSTGTMYDVVVKAGKWTCTCLGYRYHRKDCKHIRCQKQVAA